MSPRRFELKFASQVDSEHIAFSIPGESGASLLEVARQHAVKVPVACRNGVCMVCRADLVSGQVETGARRKLVEADRSSGPQEVMMCQTWPLSDCEFKVKNLLRPGELPLNMLMCQVTTVEVIQGYVYRVKLLLPAGKLPEFYAGQYLSLTLPGREAPCFYSIASPPGLRELTLHVQADPHIQSAVEVINYLTEQCDSAGLVQISLPFGKACVTSVPEKPLILMAAGTGFAQMTSIIEHMFATGFTLPIALYWGVRKEEDLYLRDLAQDWEAQHPNFSFHPLVADIDNIADNAHHNQLSDAVVADFSDLSECLVYVSGSPKLVFSAMDALMEAGLKEEQFFSDVLEYASRDN